MKGARILGKAFFWDMQAGSDGRTACATCHFHAFADARIINSSAPDAAATTFNTFTANTTRTSDDFPLYSLASPLDRLSSIVRNNSDVVGSTGVIAANFVAIKNGWPDEVWTPSTSPGPWQMNGVESRQVTHRNAPTVLNAVFNSRNFRDGRANRYFNGVDPFGDWNPDAKVWKVVSGKLQQVQVLLDNASLASQAVGPPTNSTEMSWNGKTFPDLGRKMLQLGPLALQKVDPTDCVLGPYAGPTKGLKSYISYASLIRQTFKPEWWSGGVVDGKYTQMEANFSLFWGLSILAYESMLVSDQTPYDRYASGDTTALTPLQKQGLDLFVNKAGCIKCHSGPEFTDASVSNLAAEGPIDNMPSLAGPIRYYDTGFHNTAVTKTEDDPGTAGTGPYGSFSLTARAGMSPLANKGNFKTPSLRNVELTGPYMHNGGMKSLWECVEFYVRGTNFQEHNADDFDPDAQGIPDIAKMNPDDAKANIAAIVEFMKALTDDRVRYQRAPFDHPELPIPHGHTGAGQGFALDNMILVPAVGANGGPRLATFEEILQYGLHY
jgi:cytochrome c peroxidase